MTKFTFETSVFLRKMIYSAVTERKCPVCGEGNSSMVCEKCLNWMEKAGKLHRERCKQCGKQLISEKDYCCDCRKFEKNHFSLDGNFAIYPYHLKGKKLLYLWKIKKNRILGELFSEKIMEVRKSYFPDFPLVPVPPRPEKLVREGWDQILDLSYFLKYRYKIPILNYLIRTEKRQQKKLSKKERLEKHDRYKASATLMEEKNKPETVVLVDDIYTTGATLENCGKILKENGIKNVYGITLFIVE